MNLPDWATLNQLFLFFGIILGTILVAFIFNRLFGRFIRRSTLIIKNDPTNYQFLRHAITALIYIIGFSWAVYMMPNLRTVAQSLLAGAGILAVTIGFASQHALSNVVSGIFIVIFKPFRVNDRLRLREDKLAGVVEDITLRHTVIRDFENRRIIIPNSVISEEVIVNSDFEDGRIIKWIDLSISYESDIDLARTIIQEIVINHPLSVDNRTPEQKMEGEPQVPVRVTALGDYAVHLRAYAWAKDHSDAFQIGCATLEAIKKRFDQEEHIHIPYPHQVNLVKKMESNYGEKEK